MNRASLLFPAVLLGVAACTDSTTKVTEPVALHPVFSNSYPELNDNKHIMKLKDEGKKDAQEAEKLARDEAHARPGGGGTGISYHGGPVLLSGTNVVAIY